jgi:hypothetical protein
MKKLYLPAMCCLVMLGLMGARSLAGESKQEALKAADQWLALIDMKEYDLSWDHAAELFKRAVTKAQWKRSIQAIRPAMGDLVSRDVKSETYAKSLPGAPDGEYVVIQFSTKFTNKKSAIETVTPMKDPDGKWRVSGYYIK